MKFKKSRKISIKYIQHLIDMPDIKVISFDIFDTLLVRPAVEPKDIYYLLSRKLEKYHNHNFIELRYNAEDKLKKENSNIYDIWKFIAKKYKLSISEEKFFLNQELLLEEKLLYSRKIGKILFDYAIKSGKRVIITSDMYLPAKILNKILINKGYSGFKKIYVSCDCGYRKNSGELYKYILKEENIQGKQFLHIGDNYWSDYKVPKKQGINAKWLPSNLYLFLHDKISGNLKLRDLINLSINNRILFGYVINSIYDTKSFNKRITLTDFSKLFIFPILINIICLTNQPFFKAKYDKLFLCARDGYLPYKAFEEINIFKKTMPYKYFLASRQAYSCVIYPTPYSRLEKGSFDKKFTLKQYLNLIVLNSKLLHSIYSKLSKKEQELRVSQNRLQCKKILKRFEPELSNSYARRQDATKNYYKNVITSKRSRVAIFDCGYNGSISLALTKALSKKFKVDKVYLFQTNKNITRDKLNKTKTYLLMNANDHNGWIDMTLETMLSPLIGSCKGFVRKKGTILPILEKNVFSKEMKKDHEHVQRIALEEIKKFYTLFNEYWDDFGLFDLSIYIKILKHVFSRNKANTIILNNFEFTDTYLTNDVITLKSIIDNQSINDTWYNQLLLKLISVVKRVIKK